MPFALLSDRRSLRWLIILIPVILLLFGSYFSKLSSSTSSTLNKTHSKLLISHRSWNDTTPGPGNNWYSDVGTPLSYQAWRVKDTQGLSPEPTARSKIIHYGARVACWPDSGKGVWIRYATPLELDFLGLDCFHDTQRPWPLNGTEEAAFCTKMRMIGAEFWQLPPPESLNLRCSPLEKCVRPYIRGDLAFAWPPGGGACVVNFTTATTRWGLGLKGYFNAESMNHRCDISKTLGGFWCQEPEVCEAMWCTQYPDNCNEASLLF
jgi:hypothetical protein